MTTGVNKAQHKIFDQCCGIINDDTIKWIIFYSSNEKFYYNFKFPKTHRSSRGHLPSPADSFRSHSLQSKQRIRQYSGTRATRKWPRPSRLLSHLCFLEWHWCLSRNASWVGILKPGPKSISRSWCAPRLARSKLMTGRNSHLAVGQFFLAPRSGIHALGRGWADQLIAGRAGECAEWSNLFWL